MTFWKVILAILNTVLRWMDDFVELDSGNTKGLLVDKWIIFSLWQVIFSDYVLDQKSDETIIVEKKIRSLLVFNCSRSNKKIGKSEWILWMNILWTVKHERCFCDNMFCHLQIIFFCVSSSCGILYIFSRYIIFYLKTNRLCFVYSHLFLSPFMRTLFICLLMFILSF